MRRRSYTVAIATLLIIALAVYWAATRAPHAEFRVAIAAIVEIDPIVELRKGFRDEFDNSDFAKIHNIQFQHLNAQGDAGLANQIADKISAEKPDLVFVLGTPLAQAIQKRAPDILMVQGAVTDPVEAGLADAWSGSGRNYIATSDLPPIERQLRLMRALTPNASRIGVIYNPSEANSVAVVSRLRKSIAETEPKLKLIERPISKSSDVAEAMQSILGHVDVIYAPPDNTAHAAIAVIGQFAKENKIPFYATVDSAIKEHALATMSLDFRELGKESARLALEVLAGEDPRKLPIGTTQNPTILINAREASQLGLDLERIADWQNVKIVETTKE